MKELNGTPGHPGLLPPGVTVVPFLDRSDLVHFTTHTVLHNLTEGIILVAVILFAFLGNIRGALIVAMTIPFALLFASTCLKLKGIPANLLSLGALDFGMVVDGAVVMVENILRHLGRREGAGKPPRQQIAEAAHEVQRPVFYAIGIIITAYIPIFTLQARRRTIVQADGLDRRLRSGRRTDFFHAAGPRAGQFPVPQGRERVAQPAHEFIHSRLSGHAR